MDRTTEAIAHFIGLFSIAVDEARQRELYEEFTLRKHVQPDAPPLPDADHAVFNSYFLQDFDPYLYYRPVGHPVEPWKVGTYVDYRPLQVEIPHGFAASAYPGFHRALSGPAEPVSQVVIEPPGSVANYIIQTITLSDNDYFGVGGNGLKFSPDHVGAAHVEALVAAAQDLSPLPLVMDELPGGAAALRAFTAETAEALDRFNAQPLDGEHLFIEKSQLIDGTYVNGLKVALAPEFDDHFSMQERMERAPHTDVPIGPNATVTDHGIKVDVSVTAEAGDNVLVNDALLNNLWTGATVTAILGDHIELNAIVQINAWQDSDTLTSAISNWNKAPSANEAFNIATFERQDPLADHAHGPDNDISKTFPDFWAVTEVKGDLMIVNWLQQFTFMMDNDIGILSSSGATSYVYAGNNTGSNSTSIYEGGLAYDLIVAGGSEFDVNVVHQTNVLSDNDLIGAVAGFETTGKGSYSTSDHLLWNQAQIHNVGGADRFSRFPEDYKKAAHSMADGDNHLNHGVLSDPAFAGNEFLRVLYVSGDLLNVDYVKQTNILGDDDQVALAMNATEHDPSANWSVTTGKNALINNAAILDLDSLGKTYVGGGQYSHDVLVQADIISTDPAYGGQNPDVLVNEAVAFLDEDMFANDRTDHHVPGHLDPGNAHGDALHSLVG
jgi:hypothetical protein